MRKVLFALSALSLSTFPTYALAGGGGAVTGAVGGVAGAIAGGALEPPPPNVVTYVQEQPAPANPVVVQEQVVVGQPIPGSVVVTPVLDNPKYAYAAVNHERVIVDPNTHTVIKIIK